MNVPAVFAELQTVKVSAYEEHILLLVLNRPEVRNALNTQMISELGTVWLELYRSQYNIRAIVVTGEGDKAFCAGADLKQRNEMTVAEWQSQHRILEQMMRAMCDCPIPIIAAVNGAAFGGGLEMLLACDFAFAVPEARFAFPETRLGIIPGAMGTQWLPRVVGIKRAKEICLTGEPFDASDALRWGLINAVLQRNTLLENTLIKARQIASNGPIAVKQAKKALDASLSMDPVTGYRFEIEAYNSCVVSEDRWEGVRAFNEKRKPIFSGVQ